MDTMDNQQERAPFEKGWLAGIIDGEGCLQMACQPYRGKYHYRPMMVIGNTNPVIINKVLEIAKKNNLPTYVFSPKPDMRNKSTRKNWRVQILGLKRVKQWLDFIADDLIGKKEQAKILKEYIEYRLSIPLTTIPGVHNVSEKDEVFKEQMTQANQQYKGTILNDYTLEAHN